MDPLASGELERRVGDKVYTADEQKLGKVKAADAHILTVEHGLLRKKAFYIPMSAVNSCQEGEVYLTVAKDEMEAQDWDAPPPLPTDADGNPFAY